MTAEMAAQEELAVLHVRLDEARLSAGQLRGLLRDLQAALRAAATVIDERPPRGTVRAARFKEGSLEFVIEVVGWLPEVAQASALSLVDIASAIVGGGGLGIGVSLLMRYRDQRRQRLRDEIEERRYEELTRRLDRIEEIIEGRQRQLEIEELARQLDMPRSAVEASISAFDASVRSVNAIGESGGGTILAAERDRVARIPPGFRLPHRRPRS